ncbi:MAG: DMT family transporter [Parvibaculaceae bacterium]
MPFALPRPHSPVTGILFLLCAMAVLPFLDVVAKFLGRQEVPVVEIVWARLFFGVLLTLPFVLHGRDARVFIPTTPLIQTIRCFFNIAATACFFWSLKYLPIADTLAIFFVQPLIVTLLSPLILREHVGIRRWSAVFIGFIGTLIIIRPGFQAINPGVLFALGAGSLSALYLILTRMIAGKADPIVTTFHTNFVSVIMVSAILPFFWEMPSLEQWGLFVLLAICGTTGHFMIVLAYRHAEASLLAPLAYTEMIMATAAGWWFFGDFPDRWTFVGVGVLIACAIYISYRERKHGIRAEPEAPQP